MPLDAKLVKKPFSKMRKLLKGFPDPPASEDVHDVRTYTRRVEATIGALQLRDKKTGKDLVKNLKPIRRAAGRVRDIDVLTDLAASLDPNGDRDCRLKLMQYLARHRTKSAAKLVKKVSALEKQLRAELKQCATAAGSGIDGTKTSSATEKDKRKSREKAARSITSTLQIEQELRDWPRLNKSNIHPFRIKVKELRYVLQLGQESDSPLTDVLGEVKDQIGLWHDWNEMAGLASQVLDHGARCALTAQIRARTKKELEKALHDANALRAQYLPGKADSASRKSGKKEVASEIPPKVIEAISRLAS